jgi:DNA ligase-1
MLVSYTKCKSPEHLKKFFDEIISRGGEGVILRQPGSFYETKRSPAMLKYKPFKDMEVRVLQSAVDHRFLCETCVSLLSLLTSIRKQGIQFWCPALAALAQDIKVNTVVTIKHSGTHLKGTPRNPKIVATRPDVSLQQFKQED